jgi:hypothetical protein
MRDCGIVPTHGPFQKVNGRMFGFSHDELGAALAAIRVGTRASVAAGADVATSTFEQQC